MIYDYNISRDDDGLDYWSEDPRRALYTFFKACTADLPHPRIVRYPVRVDVDGYSDTDTTRWDRLTWQDLVREAVPALNRSRDAFCMVTIYLNGMEHDTLPYLSVPTREALLDEWTGLTGYRINNGELIDLTLDAPDI